MMVLKGDSALRLRVDVDHSVGIITNLVPCSRICAWDTRCRDGGRLVKLTECARSMC